MLSFINPPPWWFASIVANLCVAVVEYLNRSGGFGSLREAIVFTGTPILLMQWGLFYAFRDAPTFLFGWAFFTVGNVVLRLASSHWMVGEQVTMQAGFGVAMMMLGAWLVKQGIVAP